MNAAHSASTPSTGPTRAPAGTPTGATHDTGGSGPGRPSRWQAYTVADLRDRLSDGRLTSAEIIQAYLDRIRRFDSAGTPALNSVVDIAAEAMDRARELDSERRAGRVRGPLHGIPFTIKCNIAAQGLPLSAGNRKLAAYRPHTDAAVVGHLRAAGGIVLATTNMSEFAWHGTFTESSVRGRTANIFDRTRSASGSSGGSAVSVAAGFAPISLGTDSCGSVLGPAAHAGLAGFRPSSDAVGRRGVLPLSPSQDVAGPIGRTVRDIAEFADLMTGGRHSWLAAVSAVDPARLTAAYLTWPFDTPASGEQHASDSHRRARIRARTDAVVATLQHNHRFTELPELDAGFARDILTGSGWTDARHSIDTFLRSAGAAFTFAELTATGSALARGIIDEWLAHPPLPNPVHDAALRGQRAGRAALTALLGRRGVDILVYPTAPDIATTDRAGTAAAGIASNTGAPSVQVPIGSVQGLPIGLTVTAAPGRDAEALAFAAAVETAADPAITVPRIG
ncbi:amidase [Nocardia carnea]|uniref:amidase n=1 Tax=Nocardia carnea TaxID=37328 RepID=UPI002458F366|nr:amidase family protein [Nocardia carnea]